MPSPRYNEPNRKNYFSGGYNVLRHGSKHSGVIDAIQIESPADKRLPDMLTRMQIFLVEQSVNLLTFITNFISYPCESNVKIGNFSFSIWAHDC